MAGRYLSVAVWFSAACLLKESSAAITPSDKTYTIAANKDINIPWTYDNAASMSQVFWTYKSSASATATTIMSKVGTASAQVFNSFNVIHDTNGVNGEIKLQEVTMDNNQGVYYCQVSYALGSNLPTVTGTATLFVTDCKCECDCVCRSIVIFGMVFGILGALSILIVLVGLLKGSFDEMATLLVPGVIGIVSDVLSLTSLILSIVVIGKECCEENCEDSECCEEDSECCKDWIDNAAIAFIVIPCVAIVVSVVIFILVKFDKIGPGNNGITKQDLRPWEEIVREKMLHVLESVYPKILSVEDLSRKVDAEESVVIKQLEELRRKDLIKQLDSGGFVRHFLDVKTAYKAEEAKEPGENDRMMETSN